MSVPKSRRKTSSMEYIATARKLAARVFRLSNGLPKRYAFKLGNPLFEHAEAVVFHCNAANLTYVKDEASYQQRRGHLVEAQAHLLHVETLLSVLFEVTAQIHDEEMRERAAGLASRGIDPTDYANPEVAQAYRGVTKAPNENVYRELAEMIEAERKLVSGVRRRDTQAYNEGRERQLAGERPDAQPAPARVPPTTGGCGLPTAPRTSAT